MSISELRQELDSLKKESAAFLAYKQVILTATINRAKLTPRVIVDGIKFVARCIDTKNWELVKRVGGVSGDLEARGACPICDINLISQNLEPRALTFPCGLEGCPFETKTPPTSENDSCHIPVK